MVVGKVLRMDEKALNELSQVVGPERLLTSPEDLVCYFYDASQFLRLHDKVMDIAQLVREALEEKQEPESPRSRGGRLIL